MKLTVVPAQVTTVEDRIIGSLSFSQMMLLVVPVFFGGALFAALPPLMGGAIYKYIIMGIIALVCCILAIRIKGKILALWLIVVLRYNLRPTYYLFNKNEVALRQDYKLPSNEEQKTEVKVRKKVPVPKLALPEAARVLAAIENPAARLSFETTKKGGLHVRLTEIES